MKLFIITLGLVLILVGYLTMRIEEEKEHTHEKQEKEEDPQINTLKNAGIGSSKDILKQRATWEDQFEQKPGEIFDNLFHGKIVGLLST